MARIVGSKSKNRDTTGNSSASDALPEEILPASKWTPGNAHHETSSEDGDNETSYTHAPLTTTIPIEFLPSGTRSLSGIAGRSFLLGVVFIASVLTTLYILLLSPTENPIWRAPLFLSTLALFHFLEFLMTAQYNAPFAEISAFLLTYNGMAYNIAHSTAMLECIITSIFFPDWQARFSNTWTVALGLAAVVTGQVVRSLAMATAGTSFTHVVQTKKRGEHVLITGGIYAWSRHPSYFGFFWWGLGTQILMGNAICTVGYAVVLWQFFGSRIRKEEEYLVAFFGREYEDYRKRTGVGIPFIGWQTRSMIH